MKTQKGFTLVELLIVIGIIAVLSTATVLVLNPAQILAEARDTQRVNDLSTLSAAISLMQATSTCPSLGGGSGSICPVTADATFACGTHVGSSSPALTAAAVTGNAALRFFTSGTEVDARNGNRTTAGLGWMAADLALASGGAPMAVLPVDPTNNITSATIGLNYQYSCNTSGQFELDANMESTKYLSYEANTFDGGSNANVYEVGSTVGL